MAAEPSQNLLLIVDCQPTRYEQLAIALGAIDNKEAGFVWEIQTKYYSSQVDIVTKTSLGDGSEGSVLFKAHAIILCYTPKDATSIQLVKESAKLMDELDYRPDVLLVVKLSSERDVDSDPEIEHLASWCNSEGLEHVDISTVSEGLPSEPPIISEANESDSEGTMEELVGIPRIIEALHSTLWPNIIRQPSKGSSAATTTSSLSEQQAMPNQKNGDDNSGNNGGDGGDDDDDDIEFPLEIVNSLEDLLRCLKSVGTNEHEDSSDFSLEDEAGHDPFEKTLRHVAFLRQMGSTLPHRHRQKLAELTAMAFATTMNLGDDDDEDDADE